MASGLVWTRLARGASACRLPIVSLHPAIRGATVTLLKARKRGVCATATASLSGMADGGAGLTGGAAVEAGRRVVTLDEATGGLPPTHPLPSIIKELRKLVAIPSVNPEHACSNPEHVGEERMAEALREAFGAAGASEAWVDAGDTAPHRPNVYAIWKADPPTDAWVGIDDHIDTVTVENMAPSDVARFSGYLTAAEGAEGDALRESLRIHGRGTCDTKATFAVLLHVLGSGKLPLRRNLIVAGTVGEETGRLGANAFNRLLKARGIVVEQMLVAEPTSLAPVHAHKGTCRLEFVVKGLAGHSSIPHKLKNAAVGAAAIVLALHKENERLTALPDAQFAGYAGLRPTVAPTVVHADAGGINVIPGEASVRCCRRVVPGEELHEVKAHLSALAAAAVEPYGLEMETRVVSLDRAFWQTPDCKLATALEGYAGTTTVTAPYGTNATAYERDVTFKEAVVFGPGDIAQAHMQDEYCSVPELLAYERILRRWLTE